MRKEAIDKAIAFSKAGFTIFKCEGKRPKKGLKWRQHPYLLPFEIDEYLGDWDGNYGIAPNRAQLIVDVDPRNFAPGDKPHQRLFKKLKLDLKSYTTVVQTGGDGLHIYFKLPPLEDGQKIKKNLAEYKGIDFISEGAYVIGAGSIHPDTNKEYRLLDFKSPSEMGFAPDELLEVLTADAAPAQLPEIEVDDSPANMLRYKEYLDMAPAAVEGANGDAVTYQVACKGRDFGLSSGMVFDIMVEAYNPKCAPAWPLEELLIKVQNAFRYATNSAGSSTPQADFQEIPKPKEAHPNWRGWDYNKGGVRKPNANNIRNFFLNFHEEDSPLHNSIVYNDFTHEITKVRKMPWDKGDRNTKWVDWTDSDTLNLLAWFSSCRHKFDVSKARLEDTLLPIAQEKTIHPVRDYLNSLKWDGVDRLETWLIDNSGLKGDKQGLDAAISKMTIMSAVARAFKPGCQADYVTVLEGRQGIRKSTLVRLLGGEFYADIKIDPSHKDTVDAMQGSWILELSEMVAYKKADVDELKRFLTIGFDKVRPAYARRAKKFYRQSIFISTVNPDATGRYLSDATGNRRFAPLDCGREMIDTLAIERIKDQLFAEATYRIQELGEKWYIDSASLIQALEIRQGQRQSIDAWEGIIQDWVDRITPHFVTAEMVYLEALAGKAEAMNTGKARRIANCLMNLGYERDQQRQNGRSIRGYSNPDYRSLERRITE